MSLPSIASLLDKRTIDHIADYAKDWAQVNGICVRLNDQAERSDLARIQAFTIAPSYVPYNLYHQAYGLQKDFGLLYHKIPFDRHFMKNTLSRVLETDTFTKRLYEIYDEVFDTMHRTQPHVLTIQRADYMFHLMDDRQNGHTKEVSGDCNDCSPFSSKYVLKQVEVNTMASGAAGIACKVAQLHDKVLKRYCSNAMTSTAFKIKGERNDGESFVLHSHDPQLSMSI
uniref:Glutathione synthase n=1 Tax=Romanomermis culicivorax TaxID=13658 RepID=A0A915JUV5_ROMCU